MLHHFSSSNSAFMLLSSSGLSIISMEVIVRALTMSGIYFQAFISSPQQWNTWSAWVLQSALISNTRGVQQERHTTHCRRHWSPRDSSEWTPCLCLSVYPYWRALYKPQVISSLVNSSRKVECNFIITSQSKPQMHHPHSSSAFFPIPLDFYFLGF